MPRPLLVGAWPHHPVHRCPLTGAGLRRSFPARPALTTTRRKLPFAPRAAPFRASKSRRAPGHMGRTPATGMNRTALMATRLLRVALLSCIPGCTGPLVEDGPGGDRTPAGQPPAPPENARAGDGPGAVFAVSRLFLGDALPDGMP